jgi:hypothetical protein
VVTGVGRDRVLQILRGLSDGGSFARQEAAAVSADLAESMSDHEAVVVGTVLAWTSIDEQDPEALEAELHALATFVEWDRLPTFVLAEIAPLDRDRLGGSALEHYEYLTSRLGGEAQA